MRRFNQYRNALSIIALIIVFSIVGWAQPLPAAGAVPPAQVDGSGLQVEVVGPAEVELNETFTVDVVATNIPEPGIFGYQFVFNWESTVFSVVEVTTNEDFPVVAREDLGESTYEIVASRQGDVEDLTGPITLLSVEVQADVVTDPDAATFSVTDAKIGRKGGINVPIVEVIDLDVVVTGFQGMGDIIGNVKVEGRAADNQAGHTVTLDELSTTTDSQGNFLFETVASGAYTAVADRAGFLEAVCEDVSHTATVLTTLLDVTLLAGDIDGDTLIDITDATAIGIVFGTPDDVADLNADGVVDVLDLILMAVNYGQTSEGNPWICQAGS